MVEYGAVAPGEEPPETFRIRQGKQVYPTTSQSGEVSVPISTVGSKCSARVGKLIVSLGAGLSAASRIAPSLPQSTNINRFAIKVFFVH